MPLIPTTDDEAQCLDARTVGWGKGTAAPVAGWRAEDRRPGRRQGRSRRGGM